METSIANSMDIAADAATLDQHVVKVFSHKSVLAILMKYAVREFEGLSAEYIAENCFLSEPVVRKMAVDQDVPDVGEIPEIFQGLEEEPEETGENDKELQEPGETVSYDALLDGNTLIDGGNTVDKTQKEGTVIYDIIFLAKAPKTNDVIEMIINVEIQNDERIRYYVVTRGLYYCSRMISAQKNRVFWHSQYEKIKKVYSIWICPYSKSGENTVTSYDIRENKIYGNSKVPESAYDKLETIVITLDEQGLESENELIRYLSLLTSRKMPIDERKEHLEKDYRLQMTEELKGEVGEMCNYSDAIYNQGLKKGFSQGISQGISQGVSQGTQLARYDAIVNLMDTTQWDVERAMRALKIPENEHKEYADQIRAKRKQQ